ncbi:MAG: alpha-glucosidase/alpha-galactosidase [Treponema sp.]|jgi:alpha-galactosidase|nr:alpha-glucosidase/alpha-galactosidase [Treponema sp.]
MKINKLKICYIGGGSRNWAWVLMQDLAFEKEIGGTIELYDIKHDDAVTNEITGNRLMEERNKGIWRFHANPSLQNALNGADFVIISILPGGFEEMAVDVHVPEKYGIYQPVGDSAGAGGIIRSMRAIPQFRHIAREVQKYAPEAWVINYTNPMSVCTRALYKEFPAIKAFGCCHEVFHTQKLLASVLEEAGLAPAGSIKREEIKVNVMGINHFTWIDRAAWKDIDIFPYYKKFAVKYAQTGFKNAQNANDNLNEDEKTRLKLFGSTDRVKMDLFLRYGLIAAAGDRHLAEFCPHSWYLSSPEAVESWGFALTPVSWRVKDCEMLKEKAIAYCGGALSMTPVESGEEGLKIVKALSGAGDITTNVNLPNKGQMPDLPSGPVVETNAVFTRGKISAVSTNGLTSDIRALVMHHVLAQEGIIEAVFENDIEKAFRIFSHDLAVQKLQLKDARSLFDEMSKESLKFMTENENGG